MLASSMLPSVCGTMQGFLPGVIGDGSASIALRRLRSSLHSRRPDSPRCACARESHHRSNELSTPGLPRADDPAGRPPTSRVERRCRCSRPAYVRSPPSSACLANDRVFSCGRRRYAREARVHQIGRLLQRRVMPHSRGSSKLRSETRRLAGARDMCICRAGRQRPRSGRRTAAR